MEKEIALVDGRLSNSGKMRDYFNGIFKAEESGEEFPVKLAHVWPIGYGRKDAAVRALTTKFVQGIDYQSVLIFKEREIGVVTEEIFTLIVSCVEYFAVRVNREVRCTEIAAKPSKTYCVAVNQTFPAPRWPPAPGPTSTRPSNKLWLR